MAWSVPWNLLGLQVSGDVGGFTIYTDRFGRKTVFPKAPPEKPPSSFQLDVRRRFKSAQAAWSALSSEEKANLESACTKTSLPLTGQNLYLSIALKNDQDGRLTIQRQSGITLPEIPYVV